MWTERVKVSFSVNSREELDRGGSLTRKNAPQETMREQRAPSGAVLKVPVAHDVATNHLPTTR